MSRVMIQGTGPETVVMVDGRAVQRLVSFSVIGDSPDHVTRVILEIEPDELDIEVDAEVERK